MKVQILHIHKNASQKIPNSRQRITWTLFTTLLVSVLLQGLLVPWTARQSDIVSVATSIIVDDPNWVNDMLGYLPDFAIKMAYAQDDTSNHGDNGSSDTTELDAENTVPDSDRDGLSDEAEVILGTNPNKADTDNDTLSDGSEVLLYGTDPLSLDTDEDQLGDSLEIITYNTDPNNPDTDKDGLLDGSELTIHLSNPRDIDTDSDGTIDGLEVANGTSPLDPTDNQPCEVCVGNTEQDVLSNNKTNIVGIQLGVAGSDTEADVEKPIIIASTHTADPGDRIAVMLEGFALSNLGTATINITYDNKVLEPVECNPDPEDKFNMVYCNMDSASGKEISFNVTSLTGITGDSTIAEIIFNVIGTAGDHSDIELTLSTIADVEGNNIVSMAVNGYVAVSDTVSNTVTESCAGDLNCDHNLDTSSALDEDNLVLEDTTDTSEIEDGTDHVQILDTADASGKIFIAEIPAGTAGIVAIPVMLQEAVDVGTLSLSVHYDSAKMSAINCVVGRNVDLGQCNYKFEPDTVRFNAISTQGMSGDLILVEIAFELLTPLNRTLRLELDIESAVDIYGTNFVRVP